VISTSSFNYSLPAAAVESNVEIEPASQNNLQDFSCAVLIGLLQVFDLLNKLVNQPDSNFCLKVSIGAQHYYNHLNI